MSLIFVDVEAGFDSPCPGVGATGMTEFGAVDYNTRESFHGLPQLELDAAARWHATFIDFEQWLKRVSSPDRPVFVSDNPAYDWQWINYWFRVLLGRNPFGHSARRIGDFYAGLRGDFHRSSQWKRLRVTRHDHNPVNDAMGNVEAFARMLNGEVA